MKKKWGKNEPRDKISYTCSECRRHCHISTTISPGELDTRKGESGIDAFMFNVRDVMCDMLENDSR